MAKRAIIGIALGILAAPIIYMVLFSVFFIGAPWNPFADWFWSLFGYGDFVGFLDGFALWGTQSLYAPLTGTYSLIEGFGSGALLTDFLPLAAPALFTWAMIGAWAGAIERNPGRGLLVGIGIWLGWLIIGLIYGLLVVGTVDILDFFMGTILTLIVVVMVGAIFGAITKSEEF